MKKIIIYSSIALVLATQPFMHAQDTKPKLTEHEKAEIRKKGLQCFAGSVLCGIYAFGSRDKLDTAFDNWRTRNLTINVDLLRGLQDTINFGIIPSEGGRVLLSALGSVNLAVCGALCFLNPEFVADMHAKFALK